MRQDIFNNNGLVRFKQLFAVLVHCFDRVSHDGMILEASFENF